MSSLFEHYQRLCEKCNFTATGRAQIEREFLLPNKRSVKFKWAGTCRKCRAIRKMDKIRAEIDKIDAARDRLHEKRRFDRAATLAATGEKS